MMAFAMARAMVHCYLDDPSLRPSYVDQKKDSLPYSDGLGDDPSQVRRSIMARALVQSTSIPSSVAGERTTKFNEFGKTKRTVTMLWNAQSSSLRLRDFTGLRGCNAIDTLVRSGQTLQSKVAAATSARRPRGCRSVPKAMFERFTEKAIKVIMLAQEEARRLGHNFVGTEQILLGLIGEGTGIAAKVLKSMGINLKDARVEVEKIIGRGSGFVAVEIPFTPRAKRVLELSLEEARQLGHNYIGSEHLLLGLLREGEGVAARVLENLGADPSNIRTQASSRSHMLPLGSLIVIRMVGESNEAVGASVGGGTSGQKMPTLEEYGTNLTKLAEEGKLDPVVGRQPQIERVTQILGRRTKNNPCLIGEPGVGKTAIAEGLAQRIANGDVPETIEGKKVITLDMGLLVAGTKYRGEFEERLKKLMEEIKQSDEIILFIDEVHTLIGAGAAEGAIDAANILKPALARGELQVSYPPCLVLPVLFFLEIKNENYEYFCPKLLGLGCGCRTRVRIRVSDPS
ncbi:Chaperone protein ClpC1, chloroplastic [Capsicum annuum]|uniref:Chaperone protein ClpC1, chloroplastic n=1 Tax=Capsicum annuum TaxID=4072 RepID=A0A2G2Y8B0_CAPAN|nr:Chaperone protein ClpC1, chloroplastic [Capsicum annuum]